MRTMPRLQHTTTRWAKSFPTVVSVPISQYTCHYERGPKICKKIFSRHCDLRSVLVSAQNTKFKTYTILFRRRHQKNHFRPSKCTHCKKGFPSPKDLERHNNSVHDNTVKYFCPHDYCRDALKPDMEGWLQWGFRRKDHWLKHLRAEHQAGQEEVKALKKEIPTAVLKDGVWSAVLGKSEQRVVANEVRSVGSSNE
jgi:hypothetical protein